ncbi:MAG: ferredoxin [Opitutae bacterium]|nr:ferredoxin [Opitutae bacterium]
MSEENNTVTINLDGDDVQVTAGANLIEAVAPHGKEIPHYCYHPKLSVVGNCRMCLVEMGMPMKDRATGEPILDENGEVKIGWMPKPVIGCGTNVAPGMHVRTDSELVHDCRNGVMEFLLVNHPLDCPICDQAGECGLQEFALDYGRGYSRFVEEKNVKPKQVELGPRVVLDDERCILCSRCIRFCQEVADDDVLGFVDRGSHSTLTCYPGKSLENNYSLNTVDICPVGALTSKDFRFRMRAWFLKETPTICSESSVGCNATVSSREGVVHRITPRRNDAVNDTWMTDSGRSLYKEIDHKDRIRSFRVGSKEVSVSEALEAATNLLGSSKVALVGSGSCSVEEQFSLKKISDYLDAPTYLAGHFGEEDGLLLSADRTPNLRGALATGLISKYPSDNLKSLGRRLAKGEINTLLCVREDLLDVGLTPTQLKGVRIVYLGTLENQTSRMAKVVLPALTTFERSGSFINLQFRLQKFLQAIPGPAGTLPDVFLLNQLLAELRKEPATPFSMDEIWTEMGKRRGSILKGFTFGEIPLDGVLLDPGKFRAFPYVERKNLHFNLSDFRKGSNTSSQQAT